MSTRQIQIQAYKEWKNSTELMYEYHTFDYYWMVRYARVYRLPLRATHVGRLVH
jgi:hypothetical protein